MNSPKKRIGTQSSIVSVGCETNLTYVSVPLETKFYGELKDIKKFEFKIF